MDTSKFKRLAWLGAGLICLALVLGIVFKADKNLVTGVLISIAAIDGYIWLRQRRLEKKGLLIAADKIKTISQRIHELWPKATDFIILCVILGVIWWLAGQVYFNTVLLGVILGHLLAYSK
jgi:hypothetical protein